MLLLTPLRIEVHFKGHWSSLNLTKRFSNIYRQPVSFHFPSQTKKSVPCTSIHIFMLKRLKTLKKSKKSMLIFPSRDQCHSLENICYSFPILHCRRIPWEGKYCGILTVSIEREVSPLFRAPIPSLQPACAPPDSLWIQDYLLWIQDYLLWIQDYLLWIKDCLLWIKDYLLWIQDYLLWIQDCLLWIQDYLLWI